MTLRERIRAIDGVVRPRYRVVWRQDDKGGGVWWLEPVREVRVIDPVTLEPARER